MQILMLCALDVWSLGTGSGAPSLFKTLQAYNDAGHTVHFVTAAVGVNVSPSMTARSAMHDAAGFNPQVCVESKEGSSLPGLPRVRVHRVRVPSLRNTLLPLPDRLLWIDQKLRFATVFPFLAARQGLRVLRRVPVDLLYGYEVHGVLAAGLLRPFYPLPLVTRFQGTVVHPALDDPLQFLRKSEEIAALKTRVDLTIMTDDGTEGDQAVARLLGELPPGFRFWRNGLDMERLRPATPEERRSAREVLSIDEGRFVVVAVSRLARWKRVDRAIRAAALLSGRLAELLLVIVGDGEERERLESLVDDLDLRGAVCFAGAVPQREVVRYYHAADVFLSTNDLSNVGNPLLEAMACGKAIVTLNNGATPRLVHDGRTGLLLDAAGDPGAIAGALLRLSADAELRQRLEAGAHAYAQRWFWTWEERMAAELRAVEALVQAV